MQNSRVRLWPSIPDESIGLPVELETRLDFYPMLSFRCELCQSLLVVRDLEIIKIRELRRIFGCSFRCNAGRIVSYVTGITTETTAKKTSKACILIFSKSLSTAIRHAQSNWHYSLEIHFRSIGNRKLIHTQLSRRNASIRSNSRRLLVTNVSPSPLA